VTQAASSEHEKTAKPCRRAVPAVQSATDESVVRKLESFVESMNVRRCVKPTTLGITDHVTLSCTSGLERQSFPVCRALAPLNGLRGGSVGSGGGVLLPFYVPFKTSDVPDHPLDLSSKTSPVGRTTSTTRIESEAVLVQSEDEAVSSDAGDEGVSSLASLQKQFGENSTMLDRIGVRRHTVSGLAPLAGAGVRIHGPSSPLNGVGLYGPALNEPCVPPPPACRPVPAPAPDGPALSTRCPPATGFDAGQSLAADRRSARRLVRGQDAWINGVSGRQRRSSVLRCLECNMSFWSLPQLTLHMIKTAHYANIVRTSVVPGPTQAEMTSSPTMTSSCSPIDSESSRESDVDNDRYFRQAAGGCSDDFRLTKSTKRQRESSPADGDDCSKRSKIWRPDCHGSSAVDRPVFRGGAMSPDGRVTPNCGGMESGRPSGLEHGRAVTSSKEVGVQLYDHSAGGRSEDVAASNDGEATRQPALTAMQDFISRSICELDRGKRRPAAMPLLPSPAPPPPPPANGLPPTMSVADLMFPLFPLAQFFPEQFLIASRAFNFLPLMQSLARLYAGGGLDAPLGVPLDFPAIHKTTNDCSFDVPRRLGTPPEVVETDSDRKGETSSSAACERRRVNGADVKSRSCHESGLPRSDVNNDQHHLSGSSRHRQKLSPTSSECDAVPSTALDSLRGFVFGDRKRSEHARSDRKYSREQRGDGHGGGSTAQDDEEAIPRHPPRQSPSASSGADSASGAPLSPSTNCHADVTDAVYAGNARITTDYDSRFDKYYRLARELSGQL